MKKATPEWFTIAEEATPEVMRRVADAVKANTMAVQVRSSSMLAHWFVLDSMQMANNANRDGMHANALALTRQCIEATGVIELGICGHAEAEATLTRWDADQLTPGKLRAWLEANVWPRYGTGLWTEPWSVFMREFAAAIQPYAHYGPKLAQWQLRLLDGPPPPPDNPDAKSHLFIEIRPRAYDAQKATRITLYHALLTYTLGRVWMAAYSNDERFGALMERLRIALGKSRYLDGHETNWGSQFWAMLWSVDGGTVLE